MIEKNNSELSFRYTTEHWNHNGKKPYSMISESLRTADVINVFLLKFLYSISLCTYDVVSDSMVSLVMFNYSRSKLLISTVAEWSYSVVPDLFPTPCVCWVVLNGSSPPIYKLKVLSPFKSNQRSHDITMNKSTYCVRNNLIPFK